jgi:hypothetical protein
MGFFIFAAFGLTRDGLRLKISKQKALGQGFCIANISSDFQFDPNEKNIIFSNLIICYSL